jgi:hypothetical protein
MPIEVGEAPIEEFRLEMESANLCYTSGVDGAPKEPNSSSRGRSSQGEPEARTVSLEGRATGQQLCLGSHPTPVEYLDSRQEGA